MKWDLNYRDPKINFVILNLVLLIGLLVWGGAGVLLVLVFLLIGEQEIGGKWFCAMLPVGARPLLSILRAHGYAPVTQNSSHFRWNFFYKARVRRVARFE